MSANYLNTKRFRTELLLGVEIMNYPIDSYELRARYAPGFIISSPFLITLWTCAPTEFKDLSVFAGGIISIIFWYCLAMFVRYCGKTAEDELWNEWSGNPAARLLLWCDENIHDDLKKQYHSLIQKHLSLPLSSKGDENSDATNAFNRAQQAFYRIRGILRKHDASGLWFVDLAEYGFARNLYGSRIVWRIVSISMLIVSGGFLIKQWNNLVFLGFLINCSMLVSAFYFGGKVMKKMAKDVALRYGQHSLESFQNIAASGAIDNEGD
jgi:hypothetical protein